MAWRDAEIDNAMGRLLQAGVSMAAFLMLLGGALYLLRHGGEIPDYRSFHGVAPEMKTFRGIGHGVLALRGRAIIQLGVLVMIATPVMRVAFAIGAFAAERDWLYTGVSVVVLALLGYALFGAH